MANVSGTGQRVCHVGIRKIAQEAAGELYESMMGNNEYYEAWKKQNPGLNAKQLESRFIAKNWVRCIDFARATLVEMLSRPDISEDMKEGIMEILEGDYELRNKFALPVGNANFH